MGDRRKVIDEFKALKKPQDPMLDSTPSFPTLRCSEGMVKLSYNSRCTFAQKYSLQPFTSAIQELPPPYPAQPTSSMASRLEACEHRALWNHQALTHHRTIIDEKREENASMK